MVLWGYRLGCVLFRYLESNLEGSFWLDIVVICHKILIKSWSFVFNLLSQSLTLSHKISWNCCWNMTCLLNICDVTRSLTGLCLIRFLRILSTLVFNYQHFRWWRSFWPSLPALLLNGLELRHRWLLLRNLWFDLFPLFLCNTWKPPTKSNFRLCFPLIDNHRRVPSISLRIGKWLPVSFRCLAWSNELTLILHWPFGCFIVKMGRLFRQRGQLFFLSSIKLEYLHIVFFLSSMFISLMANLPFGILLRSCRLRWGRSLLPVEEVWPSMH